jgi:hypothetical protein
LNFISVAPLPFADLDPLCAKKHLYYGNSRNYVAASPNLAEQLLGSPS